jgi:hypothetical protein
MSLTWEAGSCFSRETRTYPIFTTVTETPVFNIVLYPKSIKHFGYLKTVVCGYTNTQNFGKVEPHAFVLLPLQDHLGMIRLVQKSINLSWNIDPWNPSHHINLPLFFLAYGFDLAFTGLHNFFRNGENLVIGGVFPEMIAGDPSGRSLAGCMFHLMLGTDTEILFFDWVTLHTEQWILQNIKLLCKKKSKSGIKNMQKTGLQKWVNRGPGFSGNAI